MRENIKIKNLFYYFYTFANESWKICEANFTEAGVRITKATVILYTVKIIANNSSVFWNL